MNSEFEAYFLPAATSSEAIPSAESRPTENSNRMSFSSFLIFLQIKENSCLIIRRVIKLFDLFTSFLGLN